MTNKHKLMPLTDKTTAYARPHGGHYHLTKDCPMLQGGDFGRLGYISFTARAIKRKRLLPCMCAYEDFVPHKLKEK